MLSNVVRPPLCARAYSLRMPESDKKKVIDPVRVGFGMRLRSAREGAAKTQEDVAARFGVTDKTVSAWETGRGMPDALRLRDLAKFYGVSADSLLWEDSLSPDAMKFAAEFDNLTDQQQRTFRTVWTAFVTSAASDEEVERRMPGTKPVEHRGGFGSEGERE